MPDPAAALDRLAQQLLTLPLLSPDFLDARDRLDAIAAGASARLAASVNALGAAADDGGVQGVLSRQIAALQALCGLLGPAGPAPARRGWRGWLSGPPQPAAASRSAVLAEFDAAISALLASRDLLLRQSVSLDQARAVIGAAAQSLDRAAAWLAQLDPHIDAAPDRARELLFALRQHRAALAADAALAAQAQLALSAIEQNSAVLGAAIVQAAKAARAAGLAGRTAAAGDRLIENTAAEQRRLAALIDQAGQAGSAGQHRNLIDGAAPVDPARGAAQIGAALAGMQAALDTLDQQRGSLAKTARSIAQSSHG